MNNMLDIVLTEYDDELALHSVRVNASLRTTDIELKAIALGHDLINARTRVDTSTLLRADMPGRVISGILAMSKKQNMPTSDYVHQICENNDAMRVMMKCILDTTDPLRSLVSKTYVAELHQLYCHIADKQRQRKVLDMLHSKNGTHR